MNRRALLRGGAAAVALAAMGGGAWIQRRRAAGGLDSERITGEWPEAGPGVFWLLPDLRDARLVVPNRPHSVAETRDPARRAGVHRVRSCRVNTNHWRLRGKAELADAPEAGAMRIACIGDSVTFGWGVADEESWPARLAAELAGRGRRVEVLNAGVPAQRGESMAAWLERIAPRLGVQGVLFARRPYPMGKDPIAEYAGWVDRARRALPQARVHVLLPPISSFDVHGMQVYRGEGEALRRRLGDTPILELTDVLWAAQEGRDCRLQVEGKTLKVVRGETGEVLLTAQATPNELPQAIYDLFEADPTVREELFFDGGHPDAEGCVVFARAVADALETQRWFG